MTSTYPTVSKTVVLFLRLVITGFIFYSIYRLISLFSNQLANNPTFEVLYISLAYVFVLAFVIGHTIKRKKKEMEPHGLSLEMNQTSPTYFLLAIIGTVALTFLIDPLEQFFPIADKYQEFMSDLLSLKIYSFILIVLLIPILQEVLFRGIILKSFLSNYRPLKAILLSSLFFGLFHFNLAQLVTGFISGVFIGYFFWQTKSLGLCVIIHSLYNGIAFFAFHLLKTNFSIEAAIDNTPIYLMLYFGAALAITFSILFLYKKSIQQTDLSEEYSIHPKQ